MIPAQLFCWHFMAYPHLPPDFDEKYDSGWVTVPNKLWDAKKSKGLYQEYIDQMALADRLGFDGFVLNEHHQNIYGLAPSPNLIAAALTQVTSHGKIVVLGNLLPLHMNPMRVAEEYAMLDVMSDGRIIAGFAPGGGPETFNYDVPSAPSREQFWESLDLIVRAWTEDGPFVHEGKHFPLRYVNPWPKPLQKPHPPVWVPGSRSPGTLIECAKRGYCYFLSSRSHGSATGRAKDQFTEVLENHGRSYHPFRMGILLSVYVGEDDKSARAECEEGVWYFLKNCLKGHLRTEGRQLTFGPGVPYIPTTAWREYLQTTKPGRKLLGDAENWEELDSSNSIIVGGPDTVYERLKTLIDNSEVGNLLIQFHLGNMGDDITCASMERFATQVAPRLREYSAKIFAQRFPHMEDELEGTGVAQ
jgi:alkanesulfonate monooxygenase SsuD/methylene tetrahydromethanopterin reductase-like flavin-dependent oxidoreductase (luciferase family)